MPASVSTQLPPALAAGIRGTFAVVHVAPPRRGPQARRALHRLAALEQAGWPTRDIAQAAGVSTLTVKAWVRHGRADPLGPASGLEIPTPSQQAGDLITLNQFAPETSLDTTTLHRWARRGLLQGVVADRTGKRCLPRKAADQFLTDYPSLRADQAVDWLHPSVVRERLGVTWRELERLVRTGQLVAARGPAGHHRIRADSLPGLDALELKITDRR